MNSTQDSYITIATSYPWVAINHAGARSSIEQCTGILSCDEISEKLGISITTIQYIIDQLLAANFLDTQRKTIRLNNRFQSSIQSRAFHTQDQSNDAAYSQLQKRLSPELSQATWP